jgi:hypothetical protein
MSAFANQFPISLSLVVLEFIKKFLPSDKSVSDTVSQTQNLAGSCFKYMLKEIENEMNFLLLKAFITSSIPFVSQKIHILKSTNRDYQLGFI